MSQAVTHTLNPGTPEAEAGGSLEFEVNLVSRVSSGTARATLITGHEKRGEGWGGRSRAG